MIVNVERHSTSVHVLDGSGGREERNVSFEGDVSRGRGKRRAIDEPRSL